MKQYFKYGCGLLLVAFVASWGVAVAGGGSSASDNSHPVRVEPGQMWPPVGDNRFGERRITNTGREHAPAITGSYYVDRNGNVTRVEIYFPVNSRGTVDNFTGTDDNLQNDDSIKVNGGTATVNSAENIDVEINGNGTVNCDDCDHNEFDFSGSGTLSGNGNDNNDVDLHKKSGASADNFNGQNNRIYNS